MEKVTINRLIDWLKSHGHTSDEIVECIAYITGGKTEKSDYADREKVGTIGTDLPRNDEQITTQARS